MRYDSFFYKVIIDISFFGYYPIGYACNYQTYLPSLWNFVCRNIRDKARSVSIHFIHFDMIMWSYVVSFTIRKHDRNIIEYITRR